MTAPGLWWRALVAFLVLPGIVAYAAPALIGIMSSRQRPRYAGLVPVLIGTMLLLWCVREFYVAGRGTLAPWSPPQLLVTGGPYRYSRNPMYVAVITITVGWAWYFRSEPLLVYALAVLVAFHLRVVLAEEPWVTRRFGDTWAQYRAHTPRWLI